jgi:heme-degrading monooxygenase HmoA
MIARTWHGAVPIEKSDDYLQFLRTVGLSEYKDIPGNEGALILRRLEGNVAHFVMLSFWDSKEAIKAYAGDDIDVPRYHPNDRNYLLELENSIEHHDVFSNVRA